MKNVLKLALVVCGFALATFASTSEVKAKELSPVVGGGCYATGQCGVTSNGTILIGKWRE